MINEYDDNTTPLEMFDNEHQTLKDYDQKKEGQDSSLSEADENH